MTRTLSLTRETLTELTPQDLALVVGAEPIGPLVDKITNFLDCHSYKCTL